MASNRARRRVPRVVKPARGESLLPQNMAHLRLSAAQMVDLLWRMGEPPTPEQVRELSGKREPQPGRRRGATELRDRHMAYEVVRLEGMTGNSARAKRLVAAAYRVSLSVVERAVRAHRAEAERFAEAYVARLTQLGRLDSDGNIWTHVGAERTSPG